MKLFSKLRKSAVEQAEESRREYLRLVDRAARDEDVPVEEARRILDAVLRPIEAFEEDVAAAARVRALAGGPAEWSAARKATSEAREALDAYRGKVQPILEKIERDREPLEAAVRAAAEREREPEKRVRALEFAQREHERRTREFVETATVAMATRGMTAEQRAAWEQSERERIGAARRLQGQRVAAVNRLAELDRQNEEAKRMVSEATTLDARKACQERVEAIASERRKVESELSGITRLEAAAGAR